MFPLYEQYEVIVFMFSSRHSDKMFELLFYLFNDIKQTYD